MMRLAGDARLVAWLIDLMAKGQAGDRRVRWEREPGEQTLWLRLAAGSSAKSGLGWFVTGPTDF